MNIFESKKNFVFILSVMLLIVIVVFFFPGFFKPLSNKQVPQNAEIVKINTQSSDTSLDSIKKDLDDTEIDEIDKELELIDKELDAAI